MTNIYVPALIPTNPDNISGKRDDVSAWLADWHADRPNGRTWRAHRATIAAAMLAHLSPDPTTGYKGAAPRMGDDVRHAWADVASGVYVSHMRSDELAADDIALRTMANTTAADMLDNYGASLVPARCFRGTVGDDATNGKGVLGKLTGPAGRQCGADLVAGVENPVHSAKVGLLANVDRWGIIASGAARVVPVLVDLEDWLSDSL